MAPHLFTNSPEVLVTMRSLLPFMCSALLVHTASMATEGMLLAGARPGLAPCVVARTLLTQVP